MKTFRQALIECKPQQLEQIFHLWGMSGMPVKGSPTRQDVLLQRVQDPIAARFVWEYLSPDERQVLYRILGHSARSGTRRDATLKKSQLSETSFEAVITSLKQHLLLWENTVKIRSERVVSKGKSMTMLENVPLLYPYMESVDALYTAGKEYFSPKSDRSTMPFDKILSSFNHGELDIVAKHYSIPAGSYYTHAELRSMIEEELVLPNGAFEVLQRLDPPIRDLFKWLCEQGGKVSMQAVRKHTGYDDTTLLTALHQFEEYAVAFDTFSEQERVLFVPSNTSLKKAATQTEPEVVPTGLIPLAAPPAGIQASSTPIVYDLAVIIGAIYQQNIEPTQAGKVPKRLAAKIQPMLHGLPRYRYMDEEDAYMEMLFQIGQELGLVRLSQTSLEGIKARYEPGLQFEQWSQLDLTGQTRRLLECWTRSFSWLDIRGVNFRQYDPYYWNPMAARASLLEQLQKCTPGQWYSVASLLQTIWDKDPFELRPVQYNIRPADRRKTSAMRARWDSCEGEVYIGLLASTLYELGIVVPGYQEPGLAETDRFTNPDAFMLTDLGAAVLSPGDTTPLKTPASPLSNGNRSLVLQPNFELLLLRPDMPTLYSLLPFAQVNQVEMVSRLTLTRASVLRGIEAGNDIEQILRILEERSQKEIPQNVAYTLRDWVKLYKDVKVSQVLLLEVSSEAVADEICLSPKLQTFNLRKLAPRVLIASNDINLQELRRILEKEGIIVRARGDIITRQNRYAVSSGWPR
jgi:hypothetical protein